MILVWSFVCIISMLQSPCEDGGENIWWEHPVSYILFNKMHSEWNTNFTSLELSLVLLFSHPWTNKNWLIDMIYDVWNYEFHIQFMYIGWKCSNCYWIELKTIMHFVRLCRGNEIPFSGDFKKKKGIKFIQRLLILPYRKTIFYAFLCCYMLCFAACLYFHWEMVELMVLEKLIWL